MSKKTLTGHIVSDKNQKTVVVRVDSLKEHPKYKKKFKVSKKYKAHAENQGEYQVGDKVVIEETRPISKDKKWKVIKKLSSASAEKAESIEEEIASAEKTAEDSQ